jgi:hypothetical protein
VKKCGRWCSRKYHSGSDRITEEEKATATNGQVLVFKHTIATIEPVDMLKLQDFVMRD